MARNLLIAIGIFAFAYFALAYLTPDPFASTMSAAEATEALVQRGVPVPPNCVVTNVESGGLFAKYLFVRMEISPEALSHYLEKFPQGLAIGEKGEIKIVSIENYDYDPNDETETKFKHSVKDGYLRWWNIDRIEKGTYFRQSLPDACAFEVFSDEEDSVLYIYWCCS